MAPCRLDDCPSEIIESIVILLPLTDICSLRQTCRSLAEKTTQNHFKSFFLSKRVILSDEDTLRTFVKVTQPGRLGCLVQHLVLVGLATRQQEFDEMPKPYKQNLEDKRFISLLSQAFKGIAMNGMMTGKLLSVSLQIEFKDNDDDDEEQRFIPIDSILHTWRFVWPATARTFHTALRALAMSKLQLETLDVFSHLRDCSLVCDELGGCLDLFQQQQLQQQQEAAAAAAAAEEEEEEEEVAGPVGLAVSLSGLKSLSISLSDSIISIPGPTGGITLAPSNNVLVIETLKESDIQLARAKALSRTNFITLARFLQLAARNLENLEIRYYRLMTERHRQQLLQLHRQQQQQELLQDIYGYHNALLKPAAESEALKLAKLIQCRLYSIHTTDRDLLAFLQRTTTRRLFLESIFLSSGTFRTIFDYCTSETAGMQELYFEDLMQVGQFLFFFPGPSTATTTTTTAVGGHEGEGEGDGAQRIWALRRVGPEVREQPIAYYLLP